MSIRDVRDYRLRISIALIDEVVNSESKIALKQELDDDDLTSFDLRVYMTLMSLSRQHGDHNSAVYYLESLGYKTQSLNGRMFPFVQIYKENYKHLLMERLYGENWKRKYDNIELQNSIDKLERKQYVARLGEDLLLPVYIGYIEIPDNPFQTIIDHYFNKTRCSYKSLNYCTLLFCCILKQMHKNSSDRCVLSRKCLHGTEQSLFASKTRMFSESKKCLLDTGITRKSVKKKISGNIITMTEYLLVW